MLIILLSSDDNYFYINCFYCCEYVSFVISSCDIMYYHIMIVGVWRVCSIWSHWGAMGMPTAGAPIWRNATSISLMFAWARFWRRGLYYRQHRSCDKYLSTNDITSLQCFFCIATGVTWNSYWDTKRYTQCTCHCFNTKTVFPSDGDSHVKDKTVTRPSYL